MILNETPVRTSKNFGINNIEIENFQIPDKIGKFDGLTITGDTPNFELSNQVTNNQLKYGINKELENQIFENSNINLSIYEKKSGTLELEFNIDENNKNLVENIQINANLNKTSTIILKYSSEKGKECYHNGLIRVNAKANSKINIVVVNMLNSKSRNFLSIENNLADKATVNYTIVDFGGKTSVTNYYSNLHGVESKINLKTVYLGKDSQIFDINYIAELYGEKTEANIDVQGALKDYAKKNFKGTIDFKKGSKKAKGKENEFCTLLSDTARSKALPILLCTEEDVEGSHASSAGKVEEDKLFYIMSRGISYNDAIKLIVKAKFNKVLENIVNLNLKEKIIEEINKKLS